MTAIAWLPSDTETVVPEGAAVYTFLMKVASRCNLDCDYCYVYQGPDQSWRNRPKFMSPEVASRAFERIAEHVRSRDLGEVAITFHGGEPMLAGYDRIKSYLETAKALIPAKIDFGIQTNGTLLNAKCLTLFEQHDVKIGISIDGSREHNDKHRPFHNGKSSYNRVLSAIELIDSKETWRKLLTGYLCVIDLAHKPKDVFDALSSLGGRGFNVLLPDCNHERPPERPPGDDQRVAYGRWLTELFDCWMASGSQLEIRYFEEIIGMLFGVESTSEAIGAKLVDLIVVESDGEIESVDSLKMVSREATRLGLNVFEHSFDDALKSVPVASRMLGFKALCDECQNCSILEQCGGGYIPHRYSPQNGFLNPSVYCNDIKFLVAHIKRAIVENLPGKV